MGRQNGGGRQGRRIRTGQRVGKQDQCRGRGRGRRGDLRPHGRGRGQRPRRRRGGNTGTGRHHEAPHRQEASRRASKPRRLREGDRLRLLPRGQRRPERVVPPRGGRGRRIARGRRAAIEAGEALCSAATSALVSRHWGAEDHVAYSMAFVLVGLASALTGGIGDASGVLVAQAVGDGRCYLAG